MAMRRHPLLAAPLTWLVLTVLCLTGGIARCSEIVTEDNITYGKAGDTELKLDLARPEGDGPFPAIVFIHGGAWYQGNRQGYRGAIQEAAKRGYVAATISYRLMKFDESKKETTTATPIFPAQIHDAKAAIRWVRANAQKYHVDPDRIGVTGGSAGGHLSLLVGLTDPSSGLEGDSGNPGQSSWVQAVVNGFGPTDMATCYEKTALPWVARLFLGGVPNEAPDRYKAASPMTYVSKDDPPVLTLHGDKDTLVPVEQAKLLDEKMKAVGASHTLMVFEGQGHGFGGEQGKKAWDATWEFFDRHLKP
jgi:acetyl esterase/lipase